jgi:hypothetical protein
MPKAPPYLLCTLALTPCSALAAASPVIDPELLHVDSAPAASDQYGAAIASDNGILIVGSPFNDTDALQAGRVAVLRSMTLTDLGSGTSYTSWNEDVLTPGSSSHSSSAFGSALALADDYLAVGAPGWWGLGDNGSDKSGSGGVFIYEVEGFMATPTHLTTLEQPSPEVGDHFGAAIASDNHDGPNVTRFAIGAPGRATPASNISDDGGAVYIYDYDEILATWSLAATFQPADVASDDEFGASVTLAGDFLAVGAPGRNGGAVYIYLYDSAAQSWSQVELIEAADTSCADQFGRSVELWTNRLLIGGQDHASIYFLNLTNSIGTVSTSQDLEPDPSASVDDWGLSVSIDEDRAMVGSEGLIGLFRRSTTQDYDLLAMLDASDFNNESDDDLGAAVQVRGTQAWAGAPFANAAGSNTGAVVGWDVRGMPGCPADVDWDYDVDNDDLLLVLTQWGNAYWAIDERMDVNADDFVDVHDLIDVLTTFGSCP